ncbi:MAG: hypothetical protein ACI85I_001858 [Arenicella sp.]|jgi:hypothetical protein
MISKLLKISLLLLLIQQSAFSQVYRVIGKVLDGETGETIPSATVYLDKTMVGTSTSLEGEFSLDFSQSNISQTGVEMVISCIGYEPIIYALDLSNLNKKFVFKLKPKQELLDEVVVDGKRDKLWYINLQTFKEQFLGKSEFGSQCEILNTENLIITYYEKEAILKVKARETLKIRNELLGYEVDYLLESFEYQVSTGILNYAGYTFFKEMKGGESKQRRWKKNRLRAYNGSSLHFLRSLYDKNLVKEGFNLRKLTRVPNPNRPSKEEIAKARATLRANLRFSTGEVNKEEKEVMRRSRLPEFIEYLDTNTVAYADYLFEVKAGIELKFRQFLQIVYLGEKEELNYVTFSSSTFAKPRKPTFQTSVISLTSDSTILNPDGTTADTFALFYEGYWAWEKLGEMLPLGYQTESE